MEESGRKTSAIGFPYVDLDEVVSVAKAVRDKGGSRLALDQLAFALGHSTVDSGGFRLKISGARLFGLITGGRGPVELTPLGHDIADAAREARARAAAFLEVPLYRRTFEAYRGRQLPADSGLEAEFSSWGVPEKSAAKARQVFQRSAQQAGFFAYGKDRLAEPALSSSPA